MIFGIGTDIIEVKRVADKIEKPLFKERIFSESEILYCEKFHDKAERYAGRFAVKEAFLKALGQGWTGQLSLTEIETINDELGKPELHFSGRTKEIIKEKKISNAHVSISHIKMVACASVILEL